MIGGIDCLVAERDILNGVASEEMGALLSSAGTAPEELVKAVLSSRVSLLDKEDKLAAIASLPDCDEACRAGIERGLDAIREAIAKLGAFPGVVWFMRARDGKARYICEELLLSPDSAKSWESLGACGAGACLFDDEPYWIELWRMVPAEAGRYRPDYVYYLYDETPAFFGKTKGGLLYGFPDHGVLFEHPEGSPASELDPEYFGARWVPSRAIPFEVGDIVTVDLRPFGPLRTVCIVGDQNGRAALGETMVLYKDFDTGGWRLSTFDDFEWELQYAGGGRSSKPWPSVSAHNAISMGSTARSSEEDQLFQVREYLLERQGFADRRSWKSTCLQRDWSASFGAESPVSDDQLAMLLHGAEGEGPCALGSSRLL